MFRRKGWYYRRAGIFGILSTRDWLFLERLKQLMREKMNIDFH